MDAPIVVPCSACLTLNRLPRSRIQDVPVCSECRERLFGRPPAALTAADFDRFVTNCDLPVVVDFWAPWCGPCKVMAPHFASAAENLAGRAVLTRLDTEQHPELATRFGIQGIPTMILFDHGREVARTSGALQTQQIEGWILGQKVG
jgi:thioredoxin 2